MLQDLFHSVVRLEVEEELSSQAVISDMRQTVSTLLRIFRPHHLHLQDQLQQEQKEEFKAIGKFKKLFIRALHSKDAESLQFDFGTVRIATNDFSEANKLGQGGFGTVYKGRLPNGQDIAVKRLSRESAQGELEFKNEVILVAKLQHKNLVRLLDPVKRAHLDWETRYKIISGMLEVFFTFMKILDFGLFTVISKLSWRNWNEGTALNLIDPTLTVGSRSEMMRCIHIGLLCVQEHEANRPTMAQVVTMLSTYSITLPVPSKPAFLCTVN
ncbi:hypothetical protein GH714_025018 [Hevea brasiliensis]|uniref:Protein kinase domain-containing protein n=1 Tax=Hevea brasiliensis TaxID=3981 RepID=A0A6A6KTY4_HEVBR|nr:hypothetical protein GH714_025018 [Hevea brasiliensis]